MDVITSIIGTDCSFDRGDDDDVDDVVVDDNVDTVDDDSNDDAVSGLVESCRCLLDSVVDVADISDIDNRPTD